MLFFFYSKWSFDIAAKLSFTWSFFPSHRINLHFCCLRTYLRVKLIATCSGASAARHISLVTLIHWGHLRVKGYLTRFLIDIVKYMEHLHSNCHRLLRLQLWMKKSWEPIALLIFCSLSAWCFGERLVISSLYPAYCWKAGAIFNIHTILKDDSSFRKVCR